MPAQVRQSRHASLRELENDHSQTHASEGGRDDNPTESASPNDQEVQAILHDPSAVDQQPLHDQQVADQQHISDPASAFTQHARDLSSADKQTGPDHLSVDQQTNYDHFSADKQSQPRRSPVDKQEASAKARALSEVSRHPVTADKPGHSGAAGQVPYLPPRAWRERLFL